MKNLKLPCASFELAKLLKELEFDVYCKTNYYANDYLRKYHVAGDSLDHWVAYINSGKELGFTFTEWDDFRIESEMCYKAPTLELAKMWFREKHKINIQIDNVGTHWQHKMDCLDNDYSTYEEALESGLIEACELIKK